LRGIMGDEAFWAGIRSYYRAHQDGHATTADFRGEMERASGKDLRVFFDQWLTRGGLVRLDGDWTYSAGAKSIAIRLAQRDRARLFTMPLQVGVYTAGGTTPVITTVQLSDASHEFQIAVGQRPDRVVLDPNRVVLMESEFAEAKR